MATLICGSLAFDSIATFPGSLRRADPARPAAHPERVVPGAQPASRVRRLRRQHRLQPGRAGRRGDRRRRGGQRRRRLRRAAALLGRRHGAGALHRRRPHGAGLHHDRPRQQPDHGIPSRARCRRRTRSRFPGAATSPWRSSPPTAARRCCATPSNSSRRRCRSSSIRARACRCSTARRCATSSNRRPGSPSTTTKRRCSASAPGSRLEAMSRSHLRGVVVTLGAEGCDIWQGGVRTHVARRRCGADRRSDRLRRCLQKRAALRPRARLAARALRPARQPPRRPEDRQPRRPESCAGSHIRRRLSRPPLKFATNVPKRQPWTCASHPSSPSRS